MQSQVSLTLRNRSGQPSLFEATDLGIRGGESDGISLISPSAFDQDLPSEARYLVATDVVPTQQLGFLSGKEVEYHMPRHMDSRVSNDAYNDAWSQLSESDKRLLTNPTPIQSLLEQLDANDRNHQSESYFKRGRISAGLQSIENVCNYLDLLSDFIPAPNISAILGLMKGTIAVSTYSHL